MTKIQRMLTSLIGAIPAAFLCYLLVMAMLSNSENLSTMAYVMMGGTLLAAATAALMPLGILFGGTKASKPAAAKPAKAGAKAKKGEEDVEELSEDVEVAEGSSESLDVEEDDGLVESSEFDLDDSNEDMLEEATEDAVTTDQLDEDFALDDDEFEIEEEEEEVKPKPKKKR